MPAAPASLFASILIVLAACTAPAAERTAHSPADTENTAHRPADPDSAAHRIDTHPSDWLSCIQRAEHQAIWVDDCDQNHMCLDDGRAHYLECQPVAGGDTAVGACPSLNQAGCRQRDDCIVIHYRGFSEQDPIGPFAECFTEPAAQSCQADSECPSGRCQFANKTCSQQMCWGQCES